MARRKKNFQLAVQGARHEPGFEPPYLRIGGVELTAGGGRSQQASARQRRGGNTSHTQAFTQGQPSDEDEDALADYLANVLNGSDKEGSDEEEAGQAASHAFVRGADNEAGEMDGAYLDHALRGDAASSDSSTTDDDSSSDGGSDDAAGDEAPSTSRPQAATAVLSQQVVQVIRGADGTFREVSQRMSVVEAFPFTMRAADERKKSKGGAGGKRAKQRSVAKGAFHGTLLPGEKKKLKKEQKEAKRAARDARRGFDVVAAAEKISEFAEAEGDMLVLDAQGKHAQEVCLRLLRLAGLKASVQGSGKHQMVVGSWHAHSAPGPLSVAVAAKMRSTVEAELTAQRRGAAAGAVIGPAGSAFATPLAEARGGTGGGSRSQSRSQQQQQQQWLEAEQAGRPSAGSQQPATRSAAGTPATTPSKPASGLSRPAAMTKYQVPIQFVRGTTLVDNSSADTIVILPPRVPRPQLHPPCPPAAAAASAPAEETGSLAASQQPHPTTQQQGEVSSAGAAADGALAGAQAGTTGLRARTDAPPGGAHGGDGTNEHRGLGLGWGGPGPDPGGQPPPLSRPDADLPEKGIASLWEQMERRFAVQQAPAHLRAQQQHEEEHEEHQHEPHAHHQLQQQQHAHQRHQHAHQHQHHLQEPQESQLPLEPSRGQQGAAGAPHGRDETLPRSSGAQQPAVETSPAAPADHEAAIEERQQEVGGGLGLEVQVEDEEGMDDEPAGGSSGCTDSGPDDSLQESAREEEEEEEQAFTHLGLAYSGVVDSGEHVYQRVGAGLGLGLGGPASSDAAPLPSLEDQLPWELRAALQLGSSMAAGSRWPGFSFDNSSSSSSSASSASQGGSPWQSPPSGSGYALHHAARPSTRSRHGGARGRAGRHAVRSYVMEAVLGSSHSSPGLGTQRVMHSLEVGVEDEAHLAPGMVNRTKQQAKAASKKAAKLARRAAAEAAAAAPGSGEEEGGDGASLRGRAGLGSVARTSALHLTFAGFEKHTTGIGSQLMRRWGWAEGSGLGLTQQGRAVPVMAHQRPKNLGLGALPEEQANSSMRS